MADAALRLYVPHDLVRPSAAAPGGGGSGAGMTLPVAHGILPRTAARVFVPPLQVRENHVPLLELPPAVEVPTSEPDVKAAQWGDPIAAVGPPSDGRGAGGGMGDGKGKTPGRGTGNGVGPGEGPGIGRVYRAGGDTTAPRLIYKFDPEYSAEARQAKHQGAVLLRAVVDEQGRVRQIEISHPLGLGLDEKAIEAVRQWRFQPGRRDGKPVPVWAVVEVHFRLL